MELFVFSSKNLTNIWAGLGAGMWAVSQRDTSAMRELTTKSRRMYLGALGLLYCSDPEVQALTTPFVVYSAPDSHNTITNVWPEPWVMPFRIHPLGTPNKLLHKDQAKAILPIFKTKNTNNFGHVFVIQPTTVFVPTTVGTEDWQIIIEQLAE